MIDNTLPKDTSKLKLLYRLSDKKGFQASKFHKNCDDKSNTIFICENDKGQKFGGVNYLTWGEDSVGKKTDKNLIFSISKKSLHPLMMNEAGEDKGTRMSSKAILYDKNSGPIMGNTDIVIGNNCEKEESCNSDFDTYEFNLEDDSDSYLGNAENFKLKSFYIYQFS